MRIKFTGYMDVDEFDAADLDLDHPTGLSEDGHLKHVVGETGQALALSDLTDVDSEVEG